tara:strand:+ start:28 stop:486 length:459 start_codon:yes stop_codon:yes gene_type:complete
MPKVGKMKFPYTPRGIEDAQNYANHSGKALEMELPKYQYGGRVGGPMNPGMRPPVGPGFRPGMRPRIDNTVSINTGADTNVIGLPGGGEVDIGGVVMPDSRNRGLNTGMRPPLPTYRNGGMVPRRPGMGQKMSPSQINMLRNKLAKFKKGIV